MSEIGYRSPRPVREYTILCGCKRRLLGRPDIKVGMWWKCQRHHEFVGNKVTAIEFVKIGP